MLTKEKSCKKIKIVSTSRYVPIHLAFVNEQEFLLAFLTDFMNLTTIFLRSTLTLPLKKPRCLNSLFYQVPITSLFRSFVISPLLSQANKVHFGSYYITLSHKFLTQSVNSFPKQGMAWSIVWSVNTRQFKDTDIFPDKCFVIICQSSCDEIRHLPFIPWRKIQLVFL